MRSSCSDRIDIAAHAQRLDVDHRISLRIYFRIANTLLKQADIFRQEKNIIDLYVMLLRFSSLASETIPCHRDYRASVQREKDILKKKLLNALCELEKLKPAVKQKKDEFNRRNAYQNNDWGHNHQIQSPPKQNLISYDVNKAAIPAPKEHVYQNPGTRQFSYARPVEDQLRKL